MSNAGNICKSGVLLTWVTSSHPVSFKNIPVPFREFLSQTGNKNPDIDFGKKCYTSDFL
jgi:hypothetical protein